MTKTYDDVQKAFKSGSVVSADKEELEQLLLAVGRERILSEENRATAAERGETMRQLLAARQSQAMHSQALSTARIALWVSVIALVASILQALTALNIVAPLSKPALQLPSPQKSPPPKAAAPRVAPASAAGA